MSRRRGGLAVKIPGFGRPTFKVEPSGLAFAIVIGLGGSLVACRADRSKDASGAGSSPDPEHVRDSGTVSDDSAGQGEDTGVEGLAPPPQIAGACPDRVLDTAYVSSPSVWYPGTLGADGGEGEVVLRSTLYDTPWEWGSRYLSNWVDGEAPLRRGSHFSSQRAGTATVGFVPVDQAGQSGDELVCTVEFEHQLDLIVEMGTHPGFDGDRELHFVLEGGELYESATDLCWCASIVFDTEDDDATLESDEHSGGPDTGPMMQEEGVIASRHPRPFRRTLSVYDNGDGRLESPGMPYESEVRVYLDRVLVHAVRARIPPGELWTVGTVDTGTMSFEPADPDTFAPYVPPRDGCF